MAGEDGQTEQMNINLELKKNLKIKVWETI